MNFYENRLNTVLGVSVILLVFVVLFVDSDRLNSLFINYNDNLVVQEVGVLNVDYDEVVYADISSSAVLVNQEVTASTPAVVSQVASTDYWAWPTDANYVITSYYGYRWGSMHNAIDISGTGYGSNIYAANNGVVTVVKGGCTIGDLSCNGRGGNYIVIKHNYNDYYTVYMHLKDIRVNVGDVVSRGQVIGTMGNTGNVSPVPTASAPYLGTHLHFALYVGQPYNGGYTVNPMNLY